LPPGGGQQPSRSRWRCPGGRRDGLSLDRERPVKRAAASLPVISQARGRSSCVFAHQNLAFARVVGLADDAFLLHALDEGGGAVVADRQAALDVACGGFSIAENDGDGLVVEV